MSADDSALKERIDAAEAEVANASQHLSSWCMCLGMSGNTGYSSPQSELWQAIMEYARAAARLEMLRILSNEDFFLAVSHSAGKLNGHPSQ
jgi:hypothetical protein